MISMNKHELFLETINNKKKVRIKADTQEKGIIERICIPFDFGSSRKYKDGNNRYHFFDLDSPDGSHNLSILPEQLISIEVLNEGFEPKYYVRWKPISWFTPRDWGEFS